MNERISIADKKSEVKDQNKFPNIRRKTDDFQAMNSPVDRILFLQRTIGNQAVGRLIKSEALQAKLKIGQPNDIYEQEADTVAEQVMRIADVSSTKDARIQRKCPKCLNGLRGLLGKDKKDEKLQAKEASSQIHEVKPKKDLETRQASGLSEITPPSGPVRREFPPSANNSGTCEVGTSDSYCSPDLGYWPIIRNDCCTWPCSVEHEGQHVLDFDGCCRAYSKALRKPGADKLALTQMWINWWEQGRPISECRAYMNDIDCAQRLYRIWGCVPETGQAGEVSLLASGGATETGGDEALSEGTAQKSSSLELEMGETKPVVSKVKAREACCIDISWYEQTFAPEAKKWCDSAGDKAIPPCPFTAKPKKP
ncbi:MAG: hypothetical protein J5U17_05520 [Candidatus Methanoperedens sp.]|nr:hypothetical protein [Candidatus Methanoperedens sp.]